MFHAGIYKECTEALLSQDFADRLQAAPFRFFPSRNFPGPRRNPDAGEGKPPTLSRYTLQSLFAESEADTLQLQSTGAGGLELLRTPYAERLSQDKLDLLRYSASYPAFLAAITSEAFERTTVSHVPGF